LAAAPSTSKSTLCWLNPEQTTSSDVVLSDVFITFPELCQPWRHRLFLTFVPTPKQQPTDCDLAAGNGDVARPADHRASTLLRR
jgi:hypothetical protein